MGNKTSLYDAHVKAGAKIVDFAGWEMPLHYGSQIQEHHKVRQSAGVFDVSHMGVVDVTGHDAAAYLRYLLANNVDRLVPNKALYTCMLNEQGGVIDDLIVYKINDEFFRIVINAGTREKDIKWLIQQAKSFNVDLKERTDFSVLAIQGPEIKTKVAQLFSPTDAETLLTLKPFTTAALENGFFAARTGYTGEDGYEIILPNTEVNTFWDNLLTAGVAPCGLGARDTLRLEAGLNLYGTDMDETVTPLESNLEWTIAWEPTDRQFIGRAALEKQRQQGVKERLVGLVLAGQGVLRGHQKVCFPSGEEGIITSGSFSPTLSQGIALARIPANTATTCLIEIRGKQVPAHIIKPPFVRHGKKMFHLAECAEK